MIIYEVNLTINQEILDDHLTWLKSHIAEMLTFPGFQQAKVYQPITDDSAYQLTVHYELDDYTNLERYFAEQAPRMREAGLAQFGDKFQANRRILRDFTL